MQDRCLGESMLRSLGIIGVIFLSVALLAGSSSLKNFAALEVMEKVLERRRKWALGLFPSN